ncbi:MAG: PIN domain-containing protein [Candidatus Electrothrix sp. EH2]|nr:PIN domain-containing protein [Candidatus Electrothrix sp. EH2]
MIAVLDAGAAVEVVLQRPMAGLLNRYLSKADWVITPTLFISEVTNVFWKYQRLTDLALQDCERGLEQAIALPDDFIDEHNFFREAFKLSSTLNHSVYDIMYLIAARRNNAVLLTLDKKLIRIAKECSIEIPEA